MKYNIDFINNALRVMKIKVAEENRNKTQFVKMCDYAVANDSKPLLLTINLQSCIALYAYSKNFSFLAHMNVYKGNWHKEFEMNERDEFVSCKNINNLTTEIMKVRKKIKDKIKIGFVFGITPVEKSYLSRQFLERELDNLIINLNKNGVICERLEDIKSYSFVFDSTNGTIIQDDIENNGEVIFINNIPVKEKNENVILK